MNQLLKYIEDKKLAEAIKIMNENEAKKKQKKDLVDGALPGFLDKFKNELPIIKSGGVSYSLEAPDPYDPYLNIVFKYKGKSIYCEYRNQYIWRPFTEGQGTFGDWPAEKLLDFVADWYAGLQDIPAPPPEPAKLIVNDPGDPSVGFSGSSFSIDCPFFDHDDIETVEFFRSQIIKLYSQFDRNGQLTAFYDFEADIDPVDFY